MIRAALSIFFYAVFNLPVAYAQQAQVAAPNLQSYEPGAGDTAKRMLADLFGSANGIFSTGTDAHAWFGDALLSFNLAVWAIASAWFTWNTLSAVMQGSFDGEFLGRRYSSLWLPIRNVTGMALLIPAWKGWSLAQLIMAYAASLGIGIANTVAGHIPASAFPTASPVVTMPPAAEMMEKMTSGWNCVLSRRENIVRLRKANVDPDEPSVRTTWASQPYLTADAIGVNYGAIPAADGHTPSSCGTFSYQIKSGEGESPAVQTAITNTNIAFATLVQGMDKDLANLYDMVSKIDPDNDEQLKQAGQLLLSGRASIVKNWQQYQDNYYNSIRAGDEARAKEAVQAAINKNGWIGAGTAGAQSVWDSVNAALNAPEAAPKAQTAATAKKIEDPAVVQAAQLNASDGVPGELYVAPEIAAQAASSSCNWVTSANECINAKFSSMLKNGGITAMIGSSSGSPYVFGPTLGIKILKFVGWSTLAIFAIFAVAVGVATYVGLGGGAIGSLLQSFFGVWVIGMLPLVIFALQLVVMLPATMVIAWIFAVAAWLVICAEAFLAAPLWALAHMDTDGEGMGQRTAHGYIFILNLLFRPAILVIIIGFAYSFAEVIGTLANETLGGYTQHMLRATGQNWLLTLVLFVGAVWLMTVVNMRVADVSASLLSTIPNQIFTWIGGQFGSDVGSGVGAQASGDFKGGLEKVARASKDLGGQARQGARDFGRHVDRSKAGQEDGGNGPRGRVAGEEDDDGGPRRPPNGGGGGGGDRGGNPPPSSASSDARRARSGASSAQFSSNSSSTTSNGSAGAEPQTVRPNASGNKNGMATLAGSAVLAGSLSGAASAPIPHGLAGQSNASTGRTRVEDKRVESHHGESVAGSEKEEDGGFQQRSLEQEVGDES